MFRKAIVAISLSAALSFVSASAQNAATHPPQANSKATAAYVYVTTLPANSSTTEIDGFAASRSGALTPLPGSPYQYDEGAIAVDGRHLYGASLSNANIDTLSIENDGYLDYETSTNFGQFTNGCGGIGWLFTDRTGNDLYDMIFDGDCSNNGFQDYNVHPGSGELNYVSYTNGGAGSFGGASRPLTFTGNNRFTFEATNDSCMYYSFQEYQRAGNGTLTFATNYTWTPPAPPAGYRGYITEYVGADQANHLAAVFQPANPPGCSNVPAQVGSITVDNNGNLTTTSTSANMPTTLVTYPNDVKVSPSGKLVAVGGQGGLQVFHFNGGNPPTTYTPLLTTDTIAQMFWDNDDHLYAISQFSNTLHVYTVTPTAFNEVSGSPYAVSSPGGIAVQPR
jgi:hypothetical protein